MMRAHFTSNLKISGAEYLIPKRESLRYRCYYCGDLIDNEPAWAKARIAVSLKLFGSSYSMLVPFHQRCLRKYTLKLISCKILSLLVMMAILLLRGLPPASNPAEIMGTMLVLICVLVVAYEFLYRAIVLRGLGDHLIRIKQYRRYYRAR